MTYKEVYSWYRYFNSMNGISPKFIAKNLNNIFKDTTVLTEALSSSCPESIDPVKWDNMKEFYKRYLFE